MKVTNIKKIEKQEQFDITTPTENFYLSVGNVNCLIHNSPAIVFGRDSDGHFILTDINGFRAKGYDGKAKSSKELMNMLANRKPELTKDRLKFIQNMGDIFDEYEKAVPKNFRGYLLGDLLYYNTPPLIDGHYVFKPNTVEYSVDANSELGKRIGRSKTGIALHKYFIGGDPLHPEKQFDLKKAINKLKGDEVLAMPPAVPQQSPKIDTKIIDQLESIGAKYKNDISALLDPNTLIAKKMKQFPSIIYKYINQKVSSNMDDLGKDFFEWLPASGASKAMQEKIKKHIAEHKKGFGALWTIIRGLIVAKNNIAQQLDQAQTVIKQNIAGNAGRGEGYVVSHPDGPVKLVPRNVFTAAHKSES